jgi:hypothetical protein
MHLHLCQLTKPHQLAEFIEHYDAFKTGRKVFFRDAQALPSRSRVNPPLSVSEFAAFQFSFHELVAGQHYDPTWFDRVHAWAECDCSFTVEEEMSNMNGQRFSFLFTVERLFDVEYCEQSSVQLIIIKEVR